MPASDGAPFHVGLTPERVIDAAVELTRESHLMSWSIRDLARRLGVAPSVIYHHVGGKDILCRRVVERMLEGLEPPSAALDWRSWFRELFVRMGPRAGAFPGSAKWILMHGPTLPATAPVLLAGLAKLREAGFGDRARFAYTVLLNTAALIVSMADDRRQHEGDGPRDHAAMMVEFSAFAQTSPEAAAFADAFIRPFAEGGEVSERARWAYLAAVVDVVIAGLAAMLDDPALVPGGGVAPALEEPRGSAAEEAGGSTAEEPRGSAAEEL